MSARVLSIIPETVNTIHTPHSNSTNMAAKYNNTWLESPRQPWVVFDLKSGEAANILLSIDSVRRRRWRHVTDT